MKQTIKIHDVIRSSYLSVVHDDPPYGLEITPNMNRPELINLRLGSDGPTYVVNLEDLKRAVSDFSVAASPSNDRIQ